MQELSVRICYLFVFPLFSFLSRATVCNRMKWKIVAAKIITKHMTARIIIPISAKTEKKKITILDLRTLRAGHWKAEVPGNSQLLFFWQWVESFRFYWRHLYTLGRRSGPLRNPTEPDNSSQVLVSTRPRQSWEKRRWLKPKAHVFFLDKVISFQSIESWVDTELTNL